MTIIPDPKITDFTKLSEGAHNIIGINAPNVMATPPILGTGSQCIFRLLGRSKILKRQAKFIRKGITRIVPSVEIRNVENNII